jgi:SET domain-containing protein
MKKILTSKKVYISKSGIPNAGRGVFAKCDIKKNEIIEKCPFIDIPEHDMANLGESILVTYFYYFGKNKQKLIIALGFGSIYNHTYKPNAIYKIKYKEGTIDFIALHEIKKDVEITVNYSYANPKATSPLWFEVIPQGK